MVDNIDKTKTSEAAVTVDQGRETVLSGEDCIDQGMEGPCTFVIIGASGDLTSRKIIPALYNLYVMGGLPEPFLIMGCARTGLDHDSFREKMKNALKDHDSFDAEKWDRFAKALCYQQIDYNDAQSFKALAKSLDTTEEGRAIGGNRIFYLAIPPGLYKNVARMIGLTGMSKENTEGRGFARIVVEKPFGRDLASAIDLDKSLHQDFEEHQIFRIDHYLAKETVQNVLMFRFANAIFEPIWNRRYIESVCITANEAVGVEHRAGYYEQTGVLRDMFQNHMMQLLAMTAMDPPSEFEANQVRDEKVRVFRALRPFPTDRLNDYLVVGQYGPGKVDGADALGYRQEKGVDPASLTPTFAMMKIFVDNWRWNGVPFYLSSGKRLKEKDTEIVIKFKDVPHSMFRQVLGQEIASNHLVLKIHPDEKIMLTFQTKSPGAKVGLRSVTMDFNYDQGVRGPMIDAYAKALIDCMSGDQMLFWRQDGVELCWAFLTPILLECESCGDRMEKLVSYPAGSCGPAEEIDKLKNG